MSKLLYIINPEFKGSEWLPWHIDDGNSWKLFEEERGWASDDFKEFYADEGWVLNVDEICIYD